MSTSRSIDLNSGEIKRLLRALNTNSPRSFLKRKERRALACFESRSESIGDAHVYHPFSKIKDLETCDGFRRVEFSCDLLVTLGVRRPDINLAHIVGTACATSTIVHQYTDKYQSPPFLSINWWFVHSWCEALFATHVDVWLTEGRDRLHGIDEVIAK